VVWNGSEAVLAVRLEAASWPSVPPPIPIAPGTLSGIEFGVAFAVEHEVFLVTWRTASVIYFRVLDESGVPLTPVMQLVAVLAASLSASWDGTNFVVVWSAAESVLAMRVSALGVPVDSQPKSITASGAYLAKATSRPGETLIAWTNSHQDLGPNYKVRGARLNSTGAVLDPGGFMIHEAPRRMSYSPIRVASLVPESGTGTYLVAWIENYGSCGGLIVDLQDLLAATVQTDLEPVIGPVHTVSGSAAQAGVAAAVVGDNFWTAWQSETRANPEILGARRDPQGLLLDPEGIELGYQAVCRGKSGASLGSPAVAAGQVAALTTWPKSFYNDWKNTCPIEGQITSATGELISSFQFECGYAPVAASNGASFMLAFIAPNAANQPVLRWAGLSMTGGQKGGGVTDLGPNEVVRDAASDGDGYLLAWSLSGDGDDLYVGRFDETFSLLDPTGIPLVVGPGNQTHAKLASNGVEYLAVWDEIGTLRAARITPAGVVLDPGGVPVVARMTSSPFDVAWDGSHYLVAWVDIEGSDDVMRIRRVGADLSFPDPGGIEMLRRQDKLIACSVASRDDGLSLIALTTRRPAELGNRVASGHGVLYMNPGTVAVNPSSAPAAALGVQVFPNPFDTDTDFLFVDLARRLGEIRIFDSAGRSVRQFTAPEGFTPRLRWDGRDATGNLLPGGVYFYEVVAGGLRSTGKLIKLH
jgi:hypothetical protein